MTWTSGLALFCAILCWVMLGLMLYSRRIYKKLIKELLSVIKEQSKEIEELNREAHLQHRIIISQKRELER